MTSTLKKILLVLVLLLAALVSVFFVAERMKEPEVYAATAASIDDKADTVLKLTASSTLLSAGMSVLPGDAATPIAEKLADFTEYFLLVLCVLYAEKFLLTVVGAGTFRILIPIACVLLGVSLFREKRLLRQIAVKVLVFALVLCVAIPASIGVSDIIYERCSASIQNTLDTAQTLTEDSANADTEEESSSGKFGFSLAELTDRAARMVNSFVESLAVMIATSCLVPVLVLLFFIWIIKTLTGVKLPTARRGESE